MSGPAPRAISPAGWILGVCTALALALRLISIDSRGLWDDEAWRVWAARLPTFGDVLRVAWAQPPSAPLYWLGLHAWVGLFGHGDVAVRLFSVLPAVAAVPAVYWLGVRVAGRGAGVLAAGLLAVSPLAVEVGQEATMYAWSLLLATLALAAGLAWLQTGRGAWRYAACAVLLLYTHYMGALLLAGWAAAGWLWTQGPARLGSPPRVRPGAWLRLHVLIGLAWLPWLVPMGWRIAQRWDELSHLHHQAGWDDLAGSAVTLAVAASAAATWPGWRLIGAALVGATLAGLGLWAGRTAPGRPVWLLAGLACGFVGTIVGLSAATGAWLVQPRFLTLVLPPVLIVVAAGAAWIWAARPAWKMVALGLLTLWLIAQAAGVGAFYTQPVHGRNGLREIGAWLRAGVQPGDLVVSNAPILLWSVAQYYDGPLRGLPASWDVRDGYPLWPPPDQPDPAPAQWAALQVAAGGARGIWLIYLPPEDPAGFLLRQMRAYYHEEAVQTYPLATVYQFARRDAAPASR